MSQLIPLEGILNLRDLGTMKGAGGKSIKGGKLLRSSHLHNATEKDREWLEGHVSLVLDLRTAKEREEKPDPALSGAESLAFPVFDEIAIGVSREKEADEKAFASLARNPEAAKGYMAGTYRDLVRNPHCREQYRLFLDQIKAGRERAILWHCTAGKDRAGFAAVLVEALLGVSKEDILEDYLLTNEYLKEDIAGLKAMAGLRDGGLTREADEALGYLFGAEEAYLLAACDEAEKIFGSFEGFLREGLGISEAWQEELQREYLT